MFARSALFCLSILLAAASPASAAVIGEASTAKNDVTAQLQEMLRSLRAGDAVSADERVKTGSNSATVLRFLDGSELRVGASSNVVLDKFVFNPDKSAANVIINMTRGAMRFATGNSDPRNFALRTPVATLGVRGTIVMVVCDATGKCGALLDEEQAFVCPGPAATASEDCPDKVELDEDKNFVMIGPNGIITGPIHVAQSVIDAVSNAITNGNPLNLADLGLGLGGTISPFLGVVPLGALLILNGSTETTPP
jgi:hypothetical protein